MAGAISHVNLTRSGNDLVVTWRGGSEATSVFVSPDPDDAGVDVRAPDSHGLAVVSDVGDERVYVHLFDPDSGFVVAAERRLDFDGVDNLRDIGGYPTTSGGATRWGRVYRSDRLSDLTDRDHQRLARLEIGRVFDLRSKAEATSAPDRLPDHVTHEHLPISSDGARGRTMVDRIAAGDLTTFAEADLAAGYLRMLEERADAFARIVAAVAEDRPVLVHCTAGKDRTGLAMLVLLELVGVPDAHILDDYELTSLLGGGRTHVEALRGRIVEMGHDPDDFAAMWGTPRGVMRDTIEGLRARWGTVDDYLSEAGVDRSTRDAARAALAARR